MRREVCRLGYLDQIIVWMMTDIKGIYTLIDEKIYSYDKILEHEYILSGFAQIRLIPESFASDYNGWVQ
jgi:hypothetical protein